MTARVVGAILAGGRATRFGGAPKGLERVGGERIVDRVAHALRGLCDEIVLVSDAPDAPAWLDGARVVRDVMPGHGSLGGLHAALAAAHASAIDAPVLVVAWDMPFVAPPLLGALRDLVLGGADAALPAGEPLCACYGPACLTAAERLLGWGERRAGALAESVASIALGGEELARFGDPAVLFMNVNTPEDLASAEQLFRFGQDEQDEQDAS